MKNYPFAEARVRREGERNPDFRDFLAERNTDELTRRRDVVSHTLMTDRLELIQHSMSLCRGRSLGYLESSSCSMLWRKVRLLTTLIKRRFRPFDIFLLAY